MCKKKVSVPGCQGTTVQNLLQEVGLQVLKVEVEAKGEIPLHTHECAATMIVVKGGACALLGGSSRIVDVGDVIVKGPNEPHGFTNVDKPFSFISICDNDGILKERGWDITYL